MLFPAGDDGWHLQLAKAISHAPRAQRPPPFIEDQAAASSESAPKVTAREYYAYRLHQRATVEDRQGYAMMSLLCSTCDVGSSHAI